MRAAKQVKDISKGELDMLELANEVKMLNNPARLSV
jgi:hypothetical protein